MDHLAEFLKKHHPELGVVQAVRQFQGGQSNPTFLIETSERRLVLRKKPPGVLLPSAHRIEREFQVQRALSQTGVPVPNMILFCEDESIVGTSFYLMDYVEGRVSPTPDLPGLRPEDRRAAWLSLAETLARLHAVDPETVGLEDFGRPQNYLARQIDRWTRQYLASKTDEIPEMEVLLRWFAARPPPADIVAIVHGDYRIGNVLLHPTEPRVAAVLDWELSTLGHPLADLAYACMAWRLPAEGPAAAFGFAGADLDALGLPSEEAFIAAYLRAAGLDAAPDLAYFRAFSFFRFAAICQGVYARGLQGNNADPAALDHGRIARLTAAVGCSLLD